MLNDLDLTNVLVFDIETVSGVAHYDDLSPTMQYLWDLKSPQAQRGREVQHSSRDSYSMYGGIFAEFGKICCISVGTFRTNKETGELNFYVRSYYHHDERQLLLDFADLLEKRYNSLKIHKLCGHNIKEFDMPYTCRRMLINRVPLPAVLDIAGKKPWEVGHIDTMDFWKFGDYKSFTSLKLLCGVFDIPTPKDDIDGSQVGTTYWDEDDLHRIHVYCRKDVVATAQVLLSYRLSPILREDQIIMVEQEREIGTLPTTVYKKPLPAEEEEPAKAVAPAEENEVEAEKSNKKAKKNN
jgi:3'-5' exonuclease